METQEKKHALLSASSSHRWLECTPSAKAEEAYPDQSSVYAEEGTLAHAICARKLKEWRSEPHEEEEREIRELQHLYRDEMEAYTDAFVEYVKASFIESRRECRDAKLLIEHRLDFSYYVPEGFGTGDAVIVADDMITVLDFKYGKGVKVSAVENPQMKLYALGAIDEFDYGYRLRDVRCVIIQPRIGNISRWETTVEYLHQWGDMELHPLARLAYIGKGARNAGEWCRFCRAKPDCRNYAIMQRVPAPTDDFRDMV